MHMMDTNGNRSSASGSSRPRKLPTQFMFIDSTDHGVNAKPDKAVRSFVMKSARSKKPWSTRQKSPKTEANDSIESPVPSPGVAHIKTEETSPLRTRDFYLQNVSSQKPRTIKSPVSPLDQNLTRIYSTSPSSPKHVCDSPCCNGHSCSQPHGSYTVRASRPGYGVRSMAEFDCYPVRMDNKKRAMIHRCKTPVVLVC
jgi:hypothetical protein